MLPHLASFMLILMYRSSLVGSTTSYHLARLQAISKLQQDIFVEASGNLGRKYIGMSEIVILSKSYLVAIALTVKQTFHLFLFKDLDSLLSNRPMHPPLELKVQDSSSGNKLKLKPFQGATFIRLFNVGQRVYMMYATKEQQFVELTFSEGNMYFNPRYLVVVNSSNIPSECRYNLNHWTPIPIPRERKGYANFLLICSIYPHRVVPLVFNKTNGTRQVQIIFDDHNLEFQTVISHEQTAEYFSQLFWPYGHLECGTTPILIHTPQGQRFLSFFWSTGGTMGSSNPNTFFGAYLFDNNPPLRITHFSADPLLIQSFLHKKLIPIGSKEINGSIFVMLGDGISSCWIRLTINKFVHSLRNISSENLSEAYVHQHYHGRISPSYIESQFKLSRIQKRQYETFLIDDWQLIGTTRNPAVTYFNGSYLVVSCPPIDHIKWGLFQCSYQQYDNFLSRSNQNHFNLPMNVSTENDHLALSAEDIRLIVINETHLYGVFTKHRPRNDSDAYHFDSLVSELYYFDSQIFVKEPMVMNVSYESSKISQKNWIPFACPNVSTIGLCFVQRMVPHTIVSDMVVIAQSSYSPTGIYDRNNIWIYGEPRGGTQAELVDTPYGKRYFALFHSSQERGEDKRGRGIKTYYAGGYLFHTRYPYEITHISTEPLVPASFYNISQAWAHRGMDFVVFPMSLIVRGEFAYISFGVQDRAGYMVKLQLHSFFLTLHNVTTHSRSMNVKLTMQ